MRHVALLSAIALCAACLGGESNRPLGDPCSSSDECAEGLLCLYGHCRGQCSLDRDCPPGQYCVGPDGGRVCTLEGEADCTTEGCPDGLTCARDGACHDTCPDTGDCGFGRECMEEVCVEQDFCFGIDQCADGCDCSSRRCVPAGSETDPAVCYEGPGPTEIPPESALLVTTADDELDCDAATATEDSCSGGSGLSLREALLVVATIPSSQRIRFATPDLDGEQIEITLGDLPPVPSLTYLDGGDVDITIGPGPGTGLLLDGQQVILSDLTVAGFPTEGVRVAADSSRVHLFRMRIGEDGLPNGNGITIDDGCSDVHIGRGRELPAIEDPPVVAPGEGAGRATPDYRSNVICFNSGDGIVARRTEGLYISGTWIGADLWEDDNGDCPGCGNLGAGIRLEEVTDAVVGAQRLTDSELNGLVDYFNWDGSSGFTPEEDPFVTFVYVLRNGTAGTDSDTGGVVISGGGRIAMPGLVLGNTPNWNPYVQNEPANLRITATSDVVSYGAPWDGRDDDSALRFGFIFTRSVPSIVVEDNGAEVLIRGVHMVQIGLPFPEIIAIRNPVARVRLYHISFHGDDDDTSQVPFLSVRGASADVELTNSFAIYAADPEERGPLIHVDGTSSNRVILRGVVREETFRGWCDGVCDLGPPGGSEYLHNYVAGTWEPGDCPRRNGLFVFPLHPDCAETNWGYATELDVNGALPGLHNSCQPDIGAFECLTQACIDYACPW